MEGGVAAIVEELALASVLSNQRAQDGDGGGTGRCVDGSAWTGGPGFASYGDCEASEEGALMTLLCRGGATELSIMLPYAAADGAPLGTTLFVGDADDFHVTGTARFMELTGEVSLLDAPVGFDLVEALASSRGGSIETQSGSTPFHLTDSRGAIETMRSTCR